MKKVLVLGGGFAGIDTAIFLRKEKYEVTLVSDRDYFYIYPTSIWVPTGKVRFEDICIDLKELQQAHGFELIIDGVSKIEAKAKNITLESGKTLKDYDTLVIAMGADKLKPKGVEHTLSICGKPELSLEIKEGLDSLIAKGSGSIAFGFGGNPKDPSAVRGGPGFELLFNVESMLRKKGIRDNFDLHMFAPMPKPGARLGKKSYEMINKMFKKFNISKHFGTKIKGFEVNTVVFEDDTRLESDLIMFIPAGDGHEVIKNSDLPLNEAGFVKINDYCEVDGFEDVYAIGDSAALEGPDWKAKQGHLAELMAKNTAFNIIAKDKGLHERKGYVEHINIICIMDSGEGAGFAFRDDNKSFLIPMPIFGHWVKKAWGKYCRLSKLGKIPRIPGL
ncbi:FAD-dependent oxidoreductase [Sulfurimonas sp. MAG313]|nr:FAD-dependent oxidoreductase [Sulfurimonas sp. MAG313]MDF1880657.1 FAD-dependent oxidoreductase [Sulfurimonas sp. MAG313]